MTRRIGLFAGALTIDMAAQRAAGQTLFGRKPDFLVSNAATAPMWKDTVSSITGYVVPKFVANPDLPVIVSLPMFPSGKPEKAGVQITKPWEIPWTLELGAGSGFLSSPGWLYKNFDAVLRSLLKLPGRVDLRLGWEFNLSGQPWCATGHEAHYAGYWRNIVDFARKLPGGERFRWHWCPGITAWPKCDTLACYPGDDYVDVIGCDLYEGEGGPLPQDKWLTSTKGATSGGNFGLNKMLAFADAHKKPFMIHECGGHSPYFFEQVAALGVDFSLWDLNSGGYDGRLSDGTRPDALAAVRQMAR